jgi:hypothetical protein
MPKRSGGLSDQTPAPRLIKVNDHCPIGQSWQRGLSPGPWHSCKTSIHPHELPSWYLSILSSAPAVPMSGQMSQDKCRRFSLPPLLWRRLGQQDRPGASRALASKPTTTLEGGSIVHWRCLIKLKYAPSNGRKPRSTLAGTRISATGRGESSARTRRHYLA